MLAMYCSGLGAIAQEAVPKLINYQGRLTDAAGQPLSNGTYQVRFELFPDETATNNLVWGAEYTVATVVGQFNVVLGAAGGTAVNGAAINDIGFAFGSPERYLQMTLLTNGTTWSQPLVLLPRQQILSVPFAMQAQSALHGVPAGTILAFGGTNAPLGYLMCAGQSLNREDYPDLFKSIGTAFGSADLSTFNLPDLRGRFLRGTDDPDGTGTAFASANRDPNSDSRAAMATGGNTGSNLGSVQDDATARPKTGFTYSGNTSTGGAHTHPITGPWSSSEGGDGTASVLTDDQIFGQRTFPIIAGSAGSHSHTYSGSISAGGDLETRPRNAYVNYIIKY